MKVDDASRPVDLAQEPDFRLGSLQVRPSLREVVPGACEREVLEPRVMQVLVALARRPDQVVSRDQLIDACWAGRVVGEDAINRCIGRVRRLAETHGGFAVETIARVGYRLTVTVGAAVPTEPAAPAPTVSAPPPALKSRTRLTVGLVVAALIVGVAVYIGIAQTRSREHAQRTLLLTKIAELVGKDQYGAAFELARPLSRDATLLANPTFADLWRQIVVPMKPLVVRDGASVSFKPYDDPGGAW